MVVQEQDYKTASENAKFAKTVLKAFLADTCAGQHVKVNLGKDYYIDGQNTQLICFEKITTEGGKGHPKLHPRGGFFGPYFYKIFKSSHQDLYNEGSNFILSSLLSSL